MHASYHRALFERIAGHAGCVISDNRDGNFCNFGKTQDDKAWLQVRVHESHLEVGLAFDTNNPSVNGIAADRYEAALDGFSERLQRTRGKNHYLMTSVPRRNETEIDLCAADAGGVLALLRDAIDVSGVFVDM